MYELVQDTKFGREDEEDISPELSFNYMELPAREVVATLVTRTVVKRSTSITEGARY